MVRFARADGSKGSNKRQLEEPTPWTDMVTQLESAKKKLKESPTKVESGGKDGISTQSPKKSKKRKATTEDQKNPENDTQPGKQNAGEKEDQLVQDTDKKTKKKKGAKTSEPEYTITPEGKRVKVFRDGKVRTWFDLPYEESDKMTRYEGMWVKTTMVEELDRLKTAFEDEGLNKTEIMRKMMKAKRKAHRELRIELIYQQKRLVSEAIEGKGDDESTTVKKSNKGKSVRKKKKKQKNVNVDEGSCAPSSTEESVKTKMKEQCSLSDENTEEPEDFEGIKVDENDEGKEDDARVDSQVTDEVQEKKKSNDDDIKNETAFEADRSESTPSQMNRKNNEAKDSNKNVTETQDDDNLKKKKKSKETLPTQIIEQDKDEDKMEVTATTEDSLKTEETETQKPEIPKPQFTDLEQKTEEGRAEIENTESLLYEKDMTYQNNFTEANTISNSEGFEENELMTNYEGYWVLREDVNSLENAKEEELKAIYADRTDGNRESKELTKEEQILYQRALKKRKRFCHRKLTQKLSKMGRNFDSERKRRKNKNGEKKEEDSGKVVKFDGFWVKKEAADRLHKLRNKLRGEGLSQQEVDAVVQKERRKEERVLKNERKLVCLNCRQPGHMVSGCPNITQGDGEAQISICYTCGSTEHTSSSCNLKKGSNKSFSFATCFICGESGHISRQCPDNPRGLYPRGGACRGCGSVEHLAKDCPDLQNDNMESSMRVGRLKGEELEGLEKEEHEEGANHSVSAVPRPKVVTF